MHNRIETPADFAEHAHLQTRELCAKYAVSRAMIMKFRRRVGAAVPAAVRPRRPRPDDFEAMWQTMPFSKLREHYKTGSDNIQRWLGEIGYTIERNPGRPIPDDFAEVAPTLTVGQAVERFKVNVQRLYKWERATGVQCRRAHRESRGGRKPRVPAARKVREPARKKAVEFVRAAPPPHKVHTARATSLRDHGPQRDMSRAGQAADFLKKYAPVYRCNDVGAQSIGGKFWRYGNSLPLTDAELVERATRKGFDPDAWSRVAA